MRTAQSEESLEVIEPTEFFSWSNQEIGNLKILANNFCLNSYVIFSATLEKKPHYKVDVMSSNAAIAMNTKVNLSLSLLKSSLFLFSSTLARLPIAHPLNGKHNPCPAENKHPIIQLDLSAFKAYFISLFVT